jgi:hypothetical protein
VLRRDQKGKGLREVMLMRPTFAATIVMLAVASFVRAADDAKFYPPQDWTIAKQPNGSVEVQPPGVPAGKTCGLLLLPDVEGEVNVVHAMSWQQMTGQSKIVSGGNVGAGRSAAGFEKRWTAAVVDAADAKRTYMHFFSVQTGPRVRRVLYLADDREQFDEHLPTVKEMLDNVGIDPAVVAKNKAARAAALANGPGLDGVFYRARVGFDPAGERGALAQRVDYLCFSPDGRAYNGHPTGGPNVCFENDDPRSPSYGQYTINGDEVVIKWNDDPILRQQHTQKLKLLPDGKLADGDGTFHKFAACDGLKLDGAYSTTWADGSKSMIRFSRDGRFTERGLKDCVRLDQLVYPDWPRLPESGDGTYTIGRNTLEVKYDNDGPTRRMFFTTPDDPMNPKKISIGNNPLERE